MPCNENDHQNRKVFLISNIHDTTRDILSWNCKIPWCTNSPSLAQRHWKEKLISGVTIGDIDISHFSEKYLSLEQGLSHVLPCHGRIGKVLKTSLSVAFKQFQDLHTNYYFYPST